MALAVPVPKRLVNSLQTSGVSLKYECLDYDTCQSSLLLKEEQSEGFKYIIRKDLARWVVFLLIGLCTGFAGLFIEISVDILADIKYNLIRDYMDECDSAGCLYIPYLVWMSINVFFVVVGAYLVVYHAPAAGGSGVPYVKAYLNGVKVPNLLRLKTLVVKVVGVVCSLIGGLGIGKEGPMIHAGAIIGAGISQGKSTTFNHDFNLFSYFREDHEKRDFVSGGAGAGVAAAFGAPVGAVLFCLEESASFWDQNQTLRTFFATLIATFTLDVILSIYHDKFGEFSTYSFGKFDDIPYVLQEFPFFILVGVIGGVLGALYNYLSHHIAVFRMRSINKKWMKVFEAAIVSSMSATLGLVNVYFVNVCHGDEGLFATNVVNSIQMNCADGEYNVVSTLWLQTFQASVRSMFHDIPGTHGFWTLVPFLVAFYIIAVWSNGLSVSLGLFIPTMLIGAAWGRLVGIILYFQFPDEEWSSPGKYAVLGAAAQMAGVMRMTVSLTVIMIETTGCTTFGLPLIITVFSAKWVGDYLFPEGTYDIVLKLAGVPMLGWDPPPMSTSITAREIMSKPPVSFNMTESVATIVDTLTNRKHNGFPVCVKGGPFRGIILRSQLITLLVNKIFVETPGDWNMKRVTMQMFRYEYPRFLAIESVDVSRGERAYSIDLEPYISISPYTVNEFTSLPRIFRLFRGIGIRHLIVVDDNNKPIGMITRVNVVRYKMWKNCCTMGLVEVPLLSSS